MYFKCTVKVNINGHFTNEIQIQRGIKQGCVLSPLLFILYISDIARIIEKDEAGIKLSGLTISGIFFVDDLVIIGKNR